MLETYGEPLSPALSKEGDRAEDFTEKQAMKLLAPYNLSKDELAYFAYFFSIINTLTPPAFPSVTRPKFLSIKPRKSKTLVLDLDETLVHAEDDFDLNPTPLNTAQYKIRPGLKLFLKKMSLLYEIVVFTASTERHANPLIAAIDKKKRFFSGVLYRQSCVNCNGMYVKDLRVFKEHRNPKDIVIVDDSLISIAFNLDNGIVVKPYSGESDDDELTLLTNYLTTLAVVEDLRKNNAEIFKLRRLKSILEILFPKYS